MANIYTGQVTGVSKIATGTPSALCRAVTGGSLSISHNTIRKVGIQSQVHARPGILAAECTIEAVGVAKTDLALWFPTSAGVIVAAFPNLLIEVDDGVNGIEYVATGQPSRATISVGAGDDTEVEYSLGVMCSNLDSQAAGTDSCTYNSLKGHSLSDITVTIGGADYGVQSFSLENDLGAKRVNTMGTKTSGDKRWPTGVVIGAQGIKFSCVTTEPWPYSNQFADDPDWAVDIAIAMKNGTAGDDITITLSDMHPDSWNLPIGAEDVVGFEHEFGLASGQLFGRVSIS